jgi:hypothetical protein
MLPSPFSFLLRHNTIHLRLYSRLSIVVKAGFFSVHRSLKVPLQFRNKMLRPAVAYLYLKFLIQILRNNQKLWKWHNLRTVEKGKGEDAEQKIL